MDSSEEDSLDEEVNEPKESRFELVAMQLGAKFTKFDPDRVQPALPVKQDNRDKNENEMSLYDDRYASYPWSELLASPKLDDSPRDLNLFWWHFCNEEVVTDFPYSDLSIVSTLILCLDNLINLFVCSLL